MASEEAHLYHICLSPKREQPIQIVKIGADSIEGVNFNGQYGVTTLKLGGNEVGSFAARDIVGWWKQKISEQTEAPNT